LSKGRVASRFIAVDYHFHHGRSIDQDWITLAPAIAEGRSLFRFLLDWISEEERNPVDVPTIEGDVVRNCRDTL
jgi:hypothetical protein